MKVIFCEECGGRNLVDPERLDNIDEQPIICQLCENIMSQETIIHHIPAANTVDTLHYHLLFIDDDLFHLQLMKMSLEKVYTVSIASTGKQGLEMAEKQRPDLILLDINMPGIDGHEVCMQLKENQQTRQIPVIFVSAREGDDEEYRSFTLGAVDYISKPINLKILNARIAVQLRHSLLLDRDEKQADNLIKSLQASVMRAETEQERLLQEKNNFVAILNSLQERVTVGDKEKRIVWANQATLDACNMSLSEIIGKHCHEILQDSNAVCKECPFPAIRSSDLSVPVEMSSQQQGSLSLQVHRPLFDDDGELKGIAHIVTEKTTGDPDAETESSQVSEMAVSSYLANNKKALKDNISTVLFGVDAVSSMHRGDKQFSEVSRSVSEAAEQLDRMVHKLLDF